MACISITHAKYVSTPVTLVVWVPGCAVLGATRNSVHEGCGRQIYAHTNSICQTHTHTHTHTRARARARACKHARTHIGGRAQAGARAGAPARAPARGRSHKHASRQHIHNTHKRPRPLAASTTAIAASLGPARWTPPRGATTGHAGGGGQLRPEKTTAIQDRVTGV